MSDSGSMNLDLGVNLGVTLDGAGLQELSNTIKEISKGKDLQRYWKDVESATDSAAKAIERYNKNVNSKGLAENLLKQINALKALTKKENLSELFPNMELNLDELVESAKKIVPQISSQFSVDSFSQAFKTFDLLKEKSIDLSEAFRMLSKYAELVDDNLGLRKENIQFRELIGDSDVEEVKSKLSEIKRLRDQAEEIFTSFLKVNNVERTDYWGDEKFSDYFDAIRKGSLTATEAISRFKTEYAYLLEEGFKSNNDTFGLEQLQVFSNKLDSIFRQVEETSTKINDIISNGVITKSVENLSMDSSLSDSQRSLFGNLLKDEESLKSITALFQKLIEESNKTSKVDLFNDEQLQQVLSIFDKMEKHLSSLRSIISDVGDGEEFSPLLKVLNSLDNTLLDLKTTIGSLDDGKIRSVAQNLQLINKKVGKSQFNVNIKEDNSLDVMQQQEKANQFLEKQYNTWIKRYESILSIFNKNNVDPFTGLISDSEIGQMYNYDADALRKLYGKESISGLDNFREKIERITEALRLFRTMASNNLGVDDSLFNELNKLFSKSIPKNISTEYLNEKLREIYDIKRTPGSSEEKAKNLLDQINSHNDKINKIDEKNKVNDLQAVLDVLNNINKALTELVVSATTFSEKFKEGFNVTASVEEIDKLTNRVKELEDELAKIKLNPVSVDKSNISSENVTDTTESFSKINNEVNNTDQQVKKLSSDLKVLFSELKESPKEIQALLGKDGSISKITSNLSNRVKSEDIYRNILSTLNNQVFANIHNHPSGKIFSADDFSGIGNNTGSYENGNNVYGLLSGKNVKFVDFSGVDKQIASDFIKEYKKAEQEIKSQIDPDLLDEEWNAQFGKKQYEAFSNLLERFNLSDIVKNFDISDTENIAKYLLSIESYASSAITPVQKLINLVEYGSEKKLNLSDSEIKEILNSFNSGNLSGIQAFDKLMVKLGSDFHNLATNDEISKLRQMAKDTFGDAPYQGKRGDIFLEYEDQIYDLGKTAEEVFSAIKKEHSELFENTSPMKDVFQGDVASAEKLEEEIKNIDSATERASESAKEYRKILSQVGEFDIDSKVSAMYKRNDGQLESWTWRAKKDDEGNVLYDQNGKIDYDEPTITVISKYEQLEKIIVKADNELRNLQKDLAEIKSYDPTASTTNIEAKIEDQKEYIRLLEQTVKVISQSDEYLLDEQQIIEARNKAAREYALTTGAKQEKTDAKQSASDEKKRLANIEQVNRALNKQQITIDAIEKTYNKTTNPDLDREVSNQQDLAELAQKKLAIQTKINSLQGKERNSANEKEFLELEKLIAEYKELAKYKLKANNPSKQELGGQNLQTLIQVQISNYDKLITKAEKYGDATSDTVEKLKEQRDILSKIGSDGKYSATADQYYASRDTYKVESAALSAFETETRAAEHEAKAVKEVWDKNVKAIQDYMDAVTKLNNLNAKDKGTGKYSSQMALQEKNVEELKEKALEARTAITSIINPHDVPLNTWRDYLDVMKKFDQASLGSAESVAKLEDALRKMDFSSLESAGTKFESQFKNLSIKPDGDHQFLSWTNDLKELNAKIDEYNSKVKYLKENNIVDGKQVEEVKKLRDEIEETINVMTKTPQTKRGWTDIGASKAAEKVANILKQNTKMSKEAKDAIRAYYNELRSGNPSQPIDEILVKVNQLVQKERELGRVGKSFGEIFKEKVIYGGAAQLAGMFGFYDIINIFRDGIDTLKEFDDGLTKISYTMDMTKSQFDGLGKSVLDMSNNLDSSISNAMQVAQIYANMNTSAEEIQKLSAPTLILSNLTGFDASTVADDIQAVTQQFNIAAEDSMHIADVYDQISRNISVDYSKGIESIAEAVQVAGSTAKQAGKLKDLNVQKCA